MLKIEKVVTDATRAIDHSWAISRCDNLWDQTRPLTSYREIDFIWLRVKPEEVLVLR